MRFASAGGVAWLISSLLATLVGPINLVWLPEGDLSSLLLSPIRLAPFATIAAMGAIVGTIHRSSEFGRPLGIWPWVGCALTVLLGGILILVIPSRGILWLVGPFIAGAAVLSQAATSGPSGGGMPSSRSAQIVQAFTRGIGIGACLAFALWFFAMFALFLQEVSKARAIDAAVVVLFQVTLIGTPVIAGLPPVIGIVAVITELATTRRRSDES